MHSKPAKSKRIMRSIHRAMYGPLMDQGLAFTLLGSALVSLKSIGMFLFALNAKKNPQLLGISFDGPIDPRPLNGMFF